MLSDEGFSSDAINKAMKSSSFIFFNSDIIKDYSLDEYPVHPYTKTAFHEIGHAFSRKASLHGDYNRTYDRLVKEIEDIERYVNSFDALFETPDALIDGKLVRKPSILDRMKNLQLDYLRAAAREEARAEGFSHQVLAQIGKDDILPQGSQIGPNSQNLLDEYVTDEIKRTKLAAQERAIEARIKAVDKLSIEELLKLPRDPGPGDKTISDILPPIIARQGG